MKRYLRRAILAVLLLFAFIFAAAFLIQVFISDFLQDYVRSELGWTMKIGAAEIQFYPLIVRLENIELSAKDKKDPFFKAKSASASLPYSSLWREEFLINRIELDSPRMDWNSMISQSTSRNQTTVGKSKSFRIDGAVLRNGEFQFKDNRFSEITLDSQIDSRGIQIRKVQSKFNNINMHAEGILRNWSRPELDLSYTLQGDSAGIASLLKRAGEWRGDFLAEGTLRGELQRPMISGRLESSNLVVRDSAPFSISGQYQYDFRNDSNPINVTADFSSVPVRILNHYWKKMPDFTSTGRGTIHYSGGMDYWKGKGEATLLLESQKEASVPVSGEIYAHLKSGFLQIDRSNLQLLNSRVSANGKLSDDGLSFNTDFQSSHLKDFAFLDRRFVFARGNYRIHAQLTGRYEDINVSAEMTGHSGDSMIEAVGTTRLRTEAISLEFRGKAGTGILHEFLPELQKGQVQFEGSVRGSWKKPEVNASWRGTDFQIRNVEMQPFSGEANTSGNRLQFHLAAPQFQLLADGSYRLPNGDYEIHGIADGASMESLHPFYSEQQLPIRGKVYANFDASGNIHRWEQSMATMRIRAPEMQWKKAVLSISETEIQIEKRVASVHTRVESSNIHLDATGTASLRSGLPLDFLIQGRVAGAVLEKISNDWKGDGELRFDAILRGAASAPQLEGKLQTENFTANYLPQNWKIFVQQAEATISEQTLDLEGSGQFNDSSFLWKGNIPFESTAGNFHFELSNLPVSTFDTTGKLSGDLNISGDLQGGFPLKKWRAGETVKTLLDRWSANISISPSNLKLADKPLTVDQPIQLTIQDQEFRLSPARISSGDLLNFEGSGILNLATGRLESTARLETRIDLLSSLKADIQSSGVMVVDFHLGGTIQNPEYQGTIQTIHASLRIPDSPLSLEELELHASVDKKGIRLEKLQARSGGGVITGGGELIVGRKGSQVWVQGVNVAANYPEGLRSQVDFDLQLSAAESGAILAGNIRVLRSFYEQELTLKNPIVRKLLAATTQLTAEKQLKNKLQLALNIRTVQDLRLKNNLTIARAGGDLKIEGTLYKPRLTGRLNIRQGSRIFLLGNQYDVEKATVEFFGSELIEPNYDITLSTLLRDFQTDTFYEVFLPFGGSTSNIEFKNVRSTPSLSQDQIFSLVMNGTVESDPTGSSRSIFQRQILTFLAGQALGAPTATIAKSVGLSRIHIQQEGLSSVNDPKTRLMLGKDIGSGFSLIYSFVLNDPQEQTWIASYRYGRNIIGRFIDQDDSTYTVSVSHRVPFGPGSKQGSVAFDSRKKDRGPRVTSLDWKNDSPLQEKQIQQILEIDVGDPYDYWLLQDRIDKLKTELQKLGYLYPIVDVREAEDQKDLVSLIIEIHAGEPAQMIFKGYEVEEKLLKTYKKMWRIGISNVVVQQMIQDDLLRQLQLTGYYQATLNSRQEKTNERVNYYFDVNPGSRFTSVELEFQGARHYDPQMLQQDLARFYPSSGDLLREAIHDPSDLGEKIKMLYFQQGYLRTVVEFRSVQYSTSTGKIVRVIEIEEGQISQIVSVDAAQGKSIPGPLRTQMQMAAGKPFRPEALLEDELTIRDFYEKEGHQDVFIHYNVEFSKGTADLLVQWTVNAGPVARIASIRIEGNESTRMDLIRKQIGLKEGDLLTQHSRSLARKRLSDLGVFQQVGLETEETDVTGSYDVVIRVVENKKYEVQYGGRYNTDDKFSAEIRLSDFNFLGRAQNLSLYVRSTLDLPLFRIDYSMPVTGTFWDRTRFSIFRDETDEDVRATVSGELVKIPFIKKQLTFQFQQDHRLWSFYQLLWSFEYGSLTAVLEDPETPGPDEFQGTEALFRAAFVADRRDDPLNATTGYFYSLDGEYAPTLLGSDISYAKNYSQVFYYKKIGKIVSATGVRAGFLTIRSNILTFGEKFRTGGSTTLRGFEHNTVVPGDDRISIFFGGNSVFILNEEIRFPIYKWISGAVFFDAGNTYFRISDFDPTKLRYSAGFGARVGAGGFIVRFDFGFNLDATEDESRSVFHFGIGQAF